MRRKVFALVAALGAAAPAQAEWRQASTKHFVIYSEDSAKVLHDFATKLERYDQAMRYVRDAPDPELSPSNRLTVFVVSGLGKVEKLYGKGGANVAGFYMGRATGSYAITPRTGGGTGINDFNEQIVLLHEYAHHFMMQTFPGAFPAWLIEGFAEFNSTAKFEKDGSVGLGMPANHRAYGLLMASPLKIEKLLTASVAELNPQLRDQFYGRGWLLTHYLIFDASRRGQLSTYLKEINKGTGSLEAAKKAFGDLARLDKDLNKYLNQRRMSYMNLTPDKIRVGKIEIRDLTPGEAAVMDVRIRSKRGVDEAQAKALLPIERKAAAPHAESVLAQVTLAEAAYDAGDYAGSEAAADRALKADPQCVEAMIYKGRARMALAANAGKTDAATWKEVRKWFLAANRLEPDDPEPLMLFYSSFLAAGAEPTANASLGLERALELAPQDSSLRWMMAQQFLRESKPAEARWVLAPVAYDPHGGAAAQSAAAIIGKIDSGGAKAALEAWEKLGEKQKEGNAG
jgi:tetratricopeptide (TPR) repeat protein